MTEDVRKYIRFFAQDKTFAALRSGFNKIGKIRDISMDGLSFSYLRKNSEDETNKYYSNVDIFISEKEFHIYKVPCRVVYDQQGKSSGKGSDISMSRCGLQFGKLSDAQHDSLRLFISNYTEGIDDHSIVS